ncbi:hypothetical protein [Lacinutrix salivirga]
MLFENYLNTISYLYYPKGKSIFDIDYNDSLEAKRYLEKTNYNNSNNTEFNLFLKKLENKIRPLSITEFKMGLTFPSYNFQIVLDCYKSKINVLSIYISHLIPYYHICLLEGNNDVDYNKVTLKESYSFDTIKLVELIKNEITNNLFYYEFPKQFLLKKASNIRSEEKFTYLNAFFIDHYRIINF